MRSQATALGVCAGLGLIYGTATWADKTTVTVEKGQVRAQTDGGAVTVAAGQKAELKPGQKPITGVDNPMVDECLRLARLVEAERAAKRVRIDGVQINICSVESENLWKTAILNEMPNRDKTPSTTCHIGNLGGLTDPRFYDMQGNLLRYDWKKNDRNQGPCDVHFPETVAPGASFKFVCVGDATPPEQCLTHEGKVWHVRQANCSRYYLNYFRFVLPKTAILLDTNRTPLATDATDGRLSISVRNYTGQEGDGNVELAFLWPEKDGSGLEDIPAEHAGDKPAPQSNAQVQYSEQMAKIRAGQDYNDQSTPLAALLTRNAALIRKDLERLVAISYAPNDPERKGCRQELERLQDKLGGLNGVRELLVDTVEEVSTPMWPDHPREGATHMIGMHGRPSGDKPTLVFTMLLVFHEGRWYVLSNRPGPGLPPEEEWMKTHVDRVTHPSREK